MKLFREPDSHKTILLSGIASAAAIMLLMVISLFSGHQLIMGSFGASIFLLLVVPNLEFSKVKNLLGGHVLASLIGLICLQFFSFEFWALPISLFFTVIGMQIMGVSHPPAASNPIIIFLSSPDWIFIFMPTLIGAVTLALFAFFYRKIVSRVKVTSGDN